MPPTSGARGPLVLASSAHVARGSRRGPAAQPSEKALDAGAHQSRAASPDADLKRFPAGIPRVAVPQRRRRRARRNVCRARSAPVTAWTPQAWGVALSRVMARVAAASIQRWPTTRWSWPTLTRSSGRSGGQGVDARDGVVRPRDQRLGVLRRHVAGGLELLDLGLEVLELRDGVGVLAELELRRRLVELAEE